MEILISKNGKRFGPYSEAQVTGYVRQGHFTAADLAWHKGIPKWVPLSQVMTLPPVDPSAPPPLPRPGNTSSPRGFSKADILEIARGQKAMIWLFLVSLFALGFRSIPFLDASIIAIVAHLKATVWLTLFSLALFGIRFVATGILSMIYVYRLAQATRSPTPGLYAAMSLIPLIGLVVLLMVNSDATDLLRRRRIRVGLMGANKGDLAKLMAS
jgi:hypothetical protein